MLKPISSSLLRKIIFLSIIVLQFSFIACDQASSQQKTDSTAKVVNGDTTIVTNTSSTLLDTAAYNAKILELANGDTSGRWPVKTPIPRAGAILPFKRVIAYYGNLYSKQMGILGELSPKDMIAKLQEECRKWTAADTATPAIPALHYIAITAQLEPGAAKKYRLRMPFKEIDKVIEMAKPINALVFIDIQIGLSTLQQEVPEFENYFKMPHVHLGLDPEFSMKTGAKPGTVVGTFDAADINYVINYLSKIVRDNNLPPKILVVHRFTGPMVTNARLIKPTPEVQVVMDMDGWGEAERKIGTYQRFVAKEPVQYTGFKIFYKNDTKKVNRAEVMKPEQLLKLKPKPIYIQYQ